MHQNEQSWCISSFYLNISPFPHEFNTPKPQHFSFFNSQNPFTIKLLTPCIKLAQIGAKVERKAENMKKKKGFTLAEVLITLAIIGIVAAITLPSLLVNVNEKAWEAQRKALHARLAQAIGQMNTLGGYGTYTEDEEGTTTEDTAAESFIIDALSKVYKINNVCGPDKLSSCGIPSKITTLDAVSEINFPTKMSKLNAKLLNGSHVSGENGDVADTKAAAFETVNGESIAVFYNPLCSSDTTADHYIQNKMCVNFVYDLNGSEGPNQVGKDVGFITAFYNKAPVVVAPIPYNSDYTSDVPQYTETSGTVDAPTACKTMGEDLRLPDRDELASLVVNAPLINLGENGSAYWSGSVLSLGTSGLGWAQNFSYGGRARNPRSTKYFVRCIRR